jgi:hypothetical protein
MRYLIIYKYINIMYKIFINFTKIVICIWVEKFFQISVRRFPFFVSIPFRHQRERLKGV